MLLGHASVQTTERYLGTKQDLVHAPNDAIKLKDRVLEFPQPGMGDFEAALSSEANTLTHLCRSINSDAGSTLVTSN